MLKRILILGLAAVALAMVAPAIGVGGAVGVGGDVAQAQTDPAAPDQTEAPEAPDQTEAPEAPDQGDTPDAPDEGDDSGCADGASAHASGEDCIPVPQQPSPAQPSPKPENKHQKKGSGSGSGSGRESAGSEITPQVTQTIPQVVRPAANLSSGVDTGTIPQGGIQAGVGGTADDGSVSPLLPGGALILALAASGLALRRRHGLES